MCTLLPPPPRLGLRKQPKYDLPDLLDCTISIRIMRIALVLAKPDFGLLLGTCFFATKTGKILWPISHDASHNSSECMWVIVCRKGGQRAFPFIHPPPRRQGLCSDCPPPPLDAARALRNSEQLPPYCKPRVPSSRDLPVQRNGNRPSACPLVCPLVCPLLFSWKKEYLNKEGSLWGSEP